MGRYSRVSSSSSLPTYFSCFFAISLIQFSSFTTWTAFSPTLKIIPTLNLTSQSYFTIVKFDDDKHTKLNGKFSLLEVTFSSSYSITMNCFLDTYLFLILMSESTDEPKIIVGGCLVMCLFPSIIVSCPLISNISFFLKSVSKTVCSLGKNFISKKSLLMKFTGLTPFAV